MNLKYSYLAGAIVAFVIIAIIFFENVAGGLVTNLYVFGSYKSFTTGYFLITFLSIIMGIFITLFIQNIMKDIQHDIDSKGLDLN